MTTKKTEEPKRQRGRPPVAPEEQLLVGSIRLKQAHWTKLEAVGMVRLRRWLDKVKTPPPQ
jgi:hypothetical protein